MSAVAIVLIVPPNFTSLPQEILYDVWSLTIQPRYVKLDIALKYTVWADDPTRSVRERAAMRNGFHSEENFLSILDFSCISFILQEIGSRKLTSVLFVHKASREVWLPKYPWMFVGAFRKPRNGAELVVKNCLPPANTVFRQAWTRKCGARVTIELDTIVTGALPDHSCGLSLFATFGKSKELRKIRRLVIQKSEWVAVEGSDLQGLFAELWNLRKLCILVRDPIDWEYAGSSKEEPVNIRRQMLEIFRRMEQDLENYNVARIKFAAAGGFDSWYHGSRACRTLDDTR